MSKFTRLFLLTLSLLLVSNLSKAQIYPTANEVKPLLIGQKLADATLQNINGKDVNLQSLISQKPSVVVFYRGGWCPYCNAQLSGLAQIEKEVTDLGYQIIAISPENFQNIPDVAKKDKVSYTLLSDKGAELIQKTGIAFKMPENYETMLSSKVKGGLTPILPVASVFFLNKSGEITFEYINPDYKHRLSGEMLLAVLKTLK
ncbi:peroxiredoxin-like family protein [Halpernia frigidisoli]|uniref:thioredoxin-dependent peroxiredoxin n=1 Tax=Halpernia frigidisoli TaxID=1125876 RepID=A0A1I3HZB7_9FLAO|nr:peroxiredoxin-like family protein [Halpernia frigidisoli]SFI40953.1 Peroxiredoxin [Halpernia frigidisoli]